MTTITSDTSIMDILGGGASAKFFGLLEDNNELIEDMDDRDELAFKRQEKVFKEFESMSDAIDGFQNGITESINKTVTGVKDSITNPINKMRIESITAYTNFTESITDMKDGVSQKLLDVKDGFSTKLSDLKSGFTDAVAMTNNVLDTMSVKMEAFSDLPTEKQIILASKVIADGVMDTISAIPDVISSGMEKLDKGISAVGGFMKTSSGYLKGLFQKSEESEDVGGTSGISNSGKEADSKPDAGSLGGIGGLLSKMMPKGLIKMFSKTGKVLGKLGRFAGKLALPLVAIMSMFDFIGGVKNASEIIGKPEEQLSNMEKAGAGLAGIVSGLTLGFVDASTIYSEGKQMIDSVSGFARDMFDKLPLGVQDTLSEVSDFLFSSDGGLFSGIGDLFNSVIDGISQGNWGAVALDLITAPFKLLFGGNGLVSNIGTKMIEGATALFDMLPNSFQDSITGLVDTLTGWFDKIKNFAADLVPDSIKNFFGEVADSDTGKAVTSGIGAVTDFMGWTNKKEKEERKSISKLAPLDPATIKLGGTVVSQRNNSSSELAQVISERRPSVKVVKRSQVSGTAKQIKNSDTATKKSKEVMNRKQDVTPVIIQAPAPAQRAQGSGKQLNTSTTIGDTELAVMNANMMD